MVNRASSLVRHAAATAIVLLASSPGGPTLSPLSAAARNASATASQAGTVVNVASESELQSAIAALASDTTIVLAPGTYKLTSTLSIEGTLTNVVITGATNNPNDVVLLGMGMSNAQHGGVPHGISVTGSVHGITVGNLTIRDVFDHAISLGPGTESPRLSNLRLVDAGRQFVKAYPDGQGGGVDDGLVENSTFEYTVESRDADTGGVHVAGGARWAVRGNRFRNVKAPAGQIASPVVVMSQGSRDSIVERNTFVNCQQEIAFGLENRSPDEHTGGVVRNNFIVRNFTTNGSVAILVADSPGTQVLHNTILSNSASTPLIEYRFRDSSGLVIRNNLLDGNITARNGATGDVADNYLRATAAMFTAPSAGDLHLLGSATEVIDQASAVTQAATDVDGDARPQGMGADYGADEFASASTQTSSSGSMSVSAFTDPGLTSSLQSGSTTTTASTSALTSTSGLPAPWQWTDVGFPAKRGSVSWASGAFTLNAGGNDIADTADQFTFAYQTLDGDGEIVARLADLERTSPWAKAGLMVREDITAGSPYAAALVTADKGIYFQGRGETGGTTLQAYGAAGKAPQWLKLTREGNTFSVYTSADGTRWKGIASGTLRLNPVLYVGLAATSRSSRTLTTATFTDVAVAGVAANRSPDVSITSPQPGYSCKSPCNLNVSAAASDPDGSVSQVSFYADDSLIGSASSSPYTIAWSNVPLGTHRLKAVARDNDGASSTSAEIEVTVATNARPTVALTTPTTGTTYTAPASIALSASASDSDGTITQVDFFAGSMLLASDTTAPYTGAWTYVAAGSYTITAVARDNTGATTTSAPAAITVAPTNAEPTVSLTGPAPGSAFDAGTSVTLMATAADSDGTISKVEFYAGSTLVGSDATAPYSVNWTNVPSGSYELTALARDNSGATGRSTVVSITVNDPPVDEPPVVWLTSPSNNASFTAPAAITLTASTADGSSGGGGTEAPVGLVAHWKFDEASGTTATDAVGQNHGALVNGATRTSGKTGGAVRLDGRSQYVSLPRMDLTGTALTLSAWVYNTAFPKGVDQRIISKAVDTAEQSHYWMLSHTNNQTRDGSNRLRFRLRTGSRTTTLVASTGNLPLNTWYHAAATYDGTSMRLYLNGVEVGKASKTGTISTNSSVPVNIGRSPEGSNYLSGAVDDVRIYNRALTASDIQSVMSGSDAMASGALALTQESSVTAVEFYAGSTRIGSSAAAPFSVAWSNVPPGTYTLTAVARNASGQSSTSSPVTVTVRESANQGPSVSLTSPAGGSTFTAPASMNLSATASDADGTIARVDFYSGTTLVGSDTTSPYTATWSSVPAGAYTLTAVARDNSGATTTSAAVSITVRDATNQRPSVSLTSPAGGSTFTAPASISLSAAASDADGTIARVDFYSGTTLVGSDTTSPYTATWSSVPAGAYTLTAVARDNSGATTTSGPVSITVAGATALPRLVVFNASRDHDTMVTSYTVEFFAAGANPATSAPARIQNVGKPTPVNGEISIDVAASVQALPAGTYFSTVTANGANGATRSAPSESFVR